MPPSSRSIPAEETNDVIMSPVFTAAAAGAVLGRSAPKTPEVGVAIGTSVGTIVGATVGATVGGGGGVIVGGGVTIGATGIGFPIIK